MALPKRCASIFRLYFISRKLQIGNISSSYGGNLVNGSRPFSSTNGTSPVFSKAAAIVGCLGIGGGIYGYLAAPDRKERSLSLPLNEKTYSVAKDCVPAIKPSREVIGPAKDFGLDLTLYQYQSCPFCCKVRAFLDFHGISYKVIEVNPVMRQQIKFSEYKKVPILIVQEKGSDVQYQLNDSSVIISILGSLMMDGQGNLKNILQSYAPHTYKNEKGKDVDEVINKYFLMFGEKSLVQTTENLRKESEWRKWADSELVHIISPNIYRTFEEALQAFNYFSVVGEWEKNFSTIERKVVIYVGAIAMFLVGKRLKKKYLLKDDVRDSLYDACRLWMKEVGNQNKFMGGDIPNLADLAVYGLLSSIEGCHTFEDLCSHTKIESWYYNVKEAVNNHEGYDSSS